MKIISIWERFMNMKIVNTWEGLIEPFCKDSSSRVVLEHEQVYDLVKLSSKKTWFFPS